MTSHLFYILQSLDAHMEKEHFTFSSRTHAECKHCQRKLNNKHKAGIWKHLQVHVPLSERPAETKHVCFECGEQFPVGLLVFFFFGGGVVLGSRF